MNSHSEKPKMLIVDDEPDNLDLLYRTFRKDFQVLRAESGIKALEVLATEGEVAIIISDQRMPEMKGTEFLSRTVPKFPNTMRIILTGFTDVEDLVEAINSGQVYKYITKPWDPNELKAVVQRATETYQLLKQRTEELQKAQVQTALLSAIIRLVQRSSSIESSLTSIAELLGKSFAADICVLQRVAQARLLPSVGVYATGKVFVEKLVKDPLTARAIATKTIQIATNVDDEEALSQLEFYSMTGIKSHLVIPVILQTEILAMLSIQWQQPHLDLTDYELTLLNLYAQQIALVLICQGILCPDV
jgi:response regulator RpfG family c-di-GMP phosphodiesterase